MSKALISHPPAAQPAGDAFVARRRTPFVRDRGNASDIAKPSRRRNTRFYENLGLPSCAPELKYKRSIRLGDSLSNQFYQRWHGVGFCQPTKWGEGLGSHTRLKVVMSCCEYAPQAKFVKQVSRSIDTIALAGQANVHDDEGRLALLRERKGLFGRGSDTAHGKTGIYQCDLGLHRDEEVVFNNQDCTTFADFLRRFLLFSRNPFIVRSI
jgi:hypothetical protein